MSLEWVSFHNELDMLPTKTDKWHVLCIIDIWFIPEWVFYAWGSGSWRRRTVSMLLHGMLSHLLYSSLGLQLWYKIQCVFRNLFNIRFTMLLYFYCYYRSKIFLSTCTESTYLISRYMLLMSDTLLSEHLKCIIIMIVVVLRNVLLLVYSILYRVWYSHERFWHHLCAKPPLDHLVL